MLVPIKPFQVSNKNSTLTFNSTHQSLAAQFIGPSLRKQATHSRCSVASPTATMILITLQQGSSGLRTPSIATVVWIVSSTSMSQALFFTSTASLAEPHAAFAPLGLSPPRREQICLCLWQLTEMAL